MASPPSRRRPTTFRRHELRPRSLVTSKNRKVDFVISQVPHSKQRYETVGDWIPGRPAEIRVSRMKDQRYVFLVALHEMIEYELCKKNGISDNEVVAFDVHFEAERRRNMHPVEAEPGNDPRAPYRDEHDFATMIEMMVAQKLGVKWSAYEKTLLSLAPEEKVMVRPLIKNSIGASRFR
jgi:hypothetical protein